MSIGFPNTANLVPAGTAFDRVAAQYDEIFTHSAVGKAQRQLVHRELRPILVRGSRILDLNCGTGEDALNFGAQGVEVLACDASPAMIDVCRRKLQAAGAALPVEFLACANENLADLIGFGPFDGALSNFGGLNCTADLGAVSRQLAPLVRPGGALFICIMGRVCAWEISWYVLTSRWGTAFRRLRPSGATATIGGLRLRVSYPSVRQVAHACAPWFRIKACRGIGVFLPPSWLEPFFRNRPRTLRFLQWLDWRLGALPLVRGLGDHVLLRFVREEQ